MRKSVRAFVRQLRKGGELVAKQTIMTPGLCYQRKCIISGPRCGSGYCAACCRAFHKHEAPPITSSNPASSNSAGPLISTAIQPAPPPVYEVGEIRLVCSQDITTLR